MASVCERMITIHKRLQQLEMEAPEADAKVKGIPEFWLSVLMNSSDIDIYQCDVPILKHLTDITCELLSDPAVSPLVSRHLQIANYVGISGLHHLVPLQRQPVLHEHRPQEALQAEHGAGQ